MVITSYRHYTNSELLVILDSVAGRSQLIDEIALRLGASFEVIEELEADVSAALSASPIVECDVCGATVKSKTPIAETLKLKLCKA